MSAAPVGAVVSLHYDTRAIVRMGDLVQTEAGRTYVVLFTRCQEKGKHAGRWHLRCAVIDGHDFAALALMGRRVHPLVWYPRGRKRSRAIMGAPGKLH